MDGEGGEMVNDCDVWCMVRMVRWLMMMIMMYGVW